MIFLGGFIFTAIQHEVFQKHYNNICSIDILRTDTPPEERPTTAERRHKGCDPDALSSYNKLAKTGGHKGLFTFLYIRLYSRMKEYIIQD